MKNNKTDATKVLKFFREAREGGEPDAPKQTNHLGSLDDPIKRPGYEFVKMDGNSGRWVKKESVKSILDSQKIIKGNYSALSKKK
jgi:hypothetical protein